MLPISFFTCFSLWSRIETTYVADQTALLENWPTEMPHLKSSKDEAALEDVKNLSSGNLRRKRFFYNFFIYSTTLTSYSITVATTTITLSNIADNNKLSCRPSNVVICQ